jgi:hypothetical protein
MNVDRRQGERGFVAGLRRIDVSHEIETAAETNTSFFRLWEKDCGVVPRTVHDVKNVDSLRLADDAVENLAAAMSLRRTPRSS